MSAASDLALKARLARAAKETADLVNAQAIVVELGARANAEADKGGVSIRITKEKDPQIFNAIMTKAGYEYLTGLLMGFKLDKPQISKK